MIRKTFFPRLGSGCNKTESKYFCISMQRTGTTSTGKFFNDHGFNCAGWDTASRNGWSRAYWDGNLEKIFKSPDFQCANAFEDGPWFHPGLYKILYHRFPGSKFVLLKRDPDAWFASMCSHSGGYTLGQSRIHSKIYRREEEFFGLLESGVINDNHEASEYNTKAMQLGGHDEHYKRLYRLHECEVVEFFSRHDPDALHVGQLEDPEKWQKLGKFIGINVAIDYQPHENASRLHKEN